MLVCQLELLPRGLPLLFTGGDERFNDYFDRLSQVTSRYKRVLMLGDSMGASAALLFSPLATAVQAFSPQVHSTDDLQCSSCCLLGVSQPNSQHSPTLWTVSAL